MYYPGMVGGYYPGMVGRYPSWYYSPCTLVGIHLPVHVPPSHLPGIPHHLPVPVLSVQHLLLTSKCPVITAWAQKKRNPWVRPSLPPSSPKGVMKGGISLRNITPLFREERTERSDRTRVTLGVSPMVREVSARRFSRPSIRSL